MSKNINVHKETSHGLQSIPLSDELYEQRIIYFEGEMTPSSCNELIRQLEYLEHENPKETITLNISSPGGDVYSGLSVYDYIRSMDAPVNTICRGYIASMASIIFLAGDTRTMYPHSAMMIHDPSFFEKDMSGKKPHEILNELTALNKVRDTLVTIISERCGKDVEEVKTVMQEDSVFNAREAISFGLANSLRYLKEKKRHAKK